MQKRNKTFVIIFVIVLAGIGVLGYRNFIKPATSTDDAVPCINPALPIPPELHIHPFLTIVISGEKITIPANIGIERFGCERALHTHDKTGELHIEPNFAKDFTLGDFFGLWGKPFSATQILDKTAHAEHEIVMTVDGEPSTEFENLILKDGQKIVIEYKER